MSLSRAAIKLGLQLVQLKIGQAMGVPSFSVFPTETTQSFEKLYRPKTIDTARIKIPKIVTPR